MCVAIVLAAGESKRLGRPKQLLMHDGRSLVCLAVERANAAGVSAVVVITGAQSLLVTEELKASDCTIVHNERWQQGMGQSIACGVKHVLSNDRSTSAILLMVCDQPFVPTTHLKTLLATTKSNDAITATQYPGGAHGIPACFPNRHFAALSQLSGRGGAKPLIAKEGCISVVSNEAARDIDTIDDVRQLNGGRT